MSDPNTSDGPKLLAALLPPLGGKPKGGKDRLPVPPPKGAKAQAAPKKQPTATPKATGAVLGPTAAAPEANVTPAPEAGKASIDGPDLTTAMEGVKASIVDAAGVKLGEASAPVQATADEEGIPSFLAREPDQPVTKLIHAKKKASSEKAKARKAQAMQPTKAPLTEHDKKVIAEMKKAGTDKVSAVKQVGAKLKSEKEKSVTKKAKTAAKAKAAKPAKAKAPKADRAPSGMVVDILRFASRKNGVTPAELNELTKWKGAPWRWLFKNPKKTGYCDRWGYDFEVAKDDAGTHYKATKK